jgi:uncharacterized protein YodC (DUF2158 family)
MTEVIQAGDLVHLKSGGPTMTVEFIERDSNVPQARCVWFDGKKRMWANFVTQGLQKGESPDDAPPRYA